MLVGKSNQYDIPTNSLTLQRSIILWSSYFDGFLVLIFFVESYIILLTWYPEVFFWYLFAAVTMAFCNLVILVHVKFYTSCIRLDRDLAWLFANHSQVEEPDKSTSSKLMQGTKPLLARNRGIFIDTDVLKLLANSAIGRSCTQLS